MSNNIVYEFEQIDNSLDQKFKIYYGPDSLSFESDPYFTAIFTSFVDSTNYDSVKTRNNTVVTLSDINVMLEEYSIAVNLVVGFGNKNILSLVKTDNDYAYFDNGELSLKVDSDGNVTEWVR